ncbi:hypothetical protein PHYBOEH_011697 [Phytophthora boehmeriae]|uniref:EF-hand domain-containing protein n=1 Tax=Phytophthora boehmeriae TaxID=109152 RepID=A0A8T1VGE4_9STRA|nr:hypothetical protein PHYBOEH_011697 [Phytophthora boehmeriae]
MATVLQRIKDRQLTPAQECESRVVFQLAAEGSDKMTIKQLKICLRALGFDVAKGEAQVLVYEFDYTDTATIDLVDFQKVFLSKVLESSEVERFQQAFRAIAGHGSEGISVHQLSSALHATRCLEMVPGDEDIDERQIDGDQLQHQMELQYYDNENVAAVRSFLDDASRRRTEDLLVPTAALAAYLRL